MRIVCLAKRRPQQKDLITRPYGRFYYLPALLARRGHQVTAAVLSYNSEDPLVIKIENMQWHSESVFVWRSLGYLGTIRSLIRRTRPDWLIGFSDTYYGIMAASFGKKYGISCAIDAYDNFESYIPWCYPLHLLWRLAIKSADVVSAAGPQLAAYLNQFRPYQKVHVVPMAADPNIFRPLNKQECRQKLNLPIDKKLVGYCGSTYYNRGVQTIFRAYELVRRQYPNAQLVISGRKQKTIQLPADTNHMGYLSDEQVPVLLNSMDVLLVPNQISRFGNFSYPAKLYEAMACQIPVVASATEPAKWILANQKQFLARPGDASDMAEKILIALRQKRANYQNQNSWENSCDLLETALLSHSR